MALRHVASTLTLERSRCILNPSPPSGEASETSGTMPSLRFYEVPFRGRVQPSPDRRKTPRRATVTA